MEAPTFLSYCCIDHARCNKISHPFVKLRDRTTYPIALEISPNGDAIRVFAMCSAETTFIVKVTLVNGEKIVVPKGSQIFFTHEILMIETVIRGKDDKTYRDFKIV